MDESAADRKEGLLIESLTEHSLLKNEVKIFLSDVLRVLNNIRLLKDSTHSNLKSSSSLPTLLTIQTDSRKCGPDSLFVAIQGQSFDGHDFIEDVLKKGTRIFVIESASAALNSNAEATYFLVNDCRHAWTVLCAEAFGNPQDKLKIIGVTGTNGKTSTVWLIKSLLDSHQIPCLSIGTLGAFFPDSFIATAHTTPDPDQLFWLLDLAQKKGIDHVVMEVSSHSLVQHKVSCIKFSIGIFTSFSRDHLDYHKSMEEYLAAKCLLFDEHLQPTGTMIVNREIADLPTRLPKDKNIVFYSTQNAHFYEIQPNFLSHHHCHLKMSAPCLEGCQITMVIQDNNLTDKSQDSFKSWTPFFAPHALENLCAAILTFYTLKGVFPDKSSMEQLPPIPGRLEPVSNMTSLIPKDRAPFCIVDYAHTPDALLKTLTIVKSIAPGSVILVFGCGGDRDPGKRPIMGSIAAEICHKVFVTSDNPRSENPLEIIDSIRSGILPHLAAKVVYEPDRKIAIYQAIEYSLTLKPPGTVLIAGKGHETYQIIGKDKVFFDDRLVALQALEKLAPLDTVT
jgi:UDP-N-acetylmuramoyl-L-alanyl-D-glutamate--2,6-diaminopimelate ligase